MIAAFNRGDLAAARSNSSKAVQIVDLLVEFGGVAAGKAIMSLHGIDVGDPRPPIAPLSPEARDRLLTAVQKIGVVSPAKPLAALAS